MALPLRDDSPRRTVPWVVLTLIALNVAVFLFLQPRIHRDRGHRVCNIHTRLSPQCCGVFLESCGMLSGCFILFLLL